MLFHKRMLVELDELYNNIKTKLETVFSKVGHNHDDRYAVKENDSNSKISLHDGQHSRNTYWDPDGLTKVATNKDGTYVYDRYVPTDARSVVILTSINSTYFVFDITQRGTTERVDLRSDDTMIKPHSGYVDIGPVRLVYGTTPGIYRYGSINQILRIELPVEVSDAFSVTATCIATGKKNDNVTDVTYNPGLECTVHVLRIIGKYLYVYIDGHENNHNPSVAISYNIITSSE